MSNGAQIADVVESDNFEFAAVVVSNCLKYLPPNAAESVNANFDCHVNPPKCDLNV